jgi:hypothetical protein
MPPTLQQPLQPPQVLDLGEERGEGPEHHLLEPLLRALAILAGADDDLRLCCFVLELCCS